MKNFFGPKSPKILVALLVAVFAICAVGDEVSDSRKLQQEAIAAFKAKDFSVFLEKIHAAAALRPQHPSMQYQLATAYALNGRTDEALDVLERVARMGFAYPAAKDENLSSHRMRSRPAIRFWHSRSSRAASFRRDSPRDAVRWHQS
jgi:DNA-binding SARP family transcriptional activator